MRERGLWGGGAEGGLNKRNRMCCRGGLQRVLKRRRYRGS